MKICLEGWSKINHSFSISCVNKLLEFIKLPLDLKFKETSYANNLWNYSNNFHGFSDKNIKKILSIKPPERNEFFDIIYRISYPFNFQKSNSKKLFVFATSEFQNINDMFINEIPGNFSYRDDLKIITPSKWSRLGFIESGFNSNQIKICRL